MTPQRKIRIRSDQLHGTAIIVGDEIDRSEVTVGQRGEERRLDPSAGLAVEQVAHLCCDGARNQQPAVRQVQAGEQLDTLVVAIIAVESRSHDRPRVAQDHAGRPNPSSWISSDRSATSDRPALPAPKNAGGHGRPVAGAP